MTMTEDRESPESPEDSKKRREFYASAPMQAAHNLRKALAVNEGSYRLVVGHIHGDPRAYFLYGCMDEIFKVCTASMRWAELLEAPEEERKKLAESDDPTARHMHRVVTETIIDEQEMWARKLNEILTDLILFASTYGMRKGFGVGLRSLPTHTFTNPQPPERRPLGPSGM